MRIVIAGGGTGGHLFPGIALAEEIVTRHPKNDVLFVGTARGLEARIVPASGYKFETITAFGLKGVGPWRFFKAIVSLPIAVVAAWLKLWKYRPDVVVGVGGYASGPVVLAAWMQLIPTAVQEQNALPGFTNRVLGRLVRAVFISFEEARRYFPAHKVHLVGNPIRRALLENYLRSTTRHDSFTVLVFGGSQGARSINRRMIDALHYLTDFRNELHFIHQTGKDDLDAVREGYRSTGFSAEVLEFIDDMSSAYARSELVVCRAGATTLAELTVCRKPSILIPYPHAADNHQEVNARALVTAGAAVMLREVELSGERLAQALITLVTDQSQRLRMEKNAGILGRPEAAKELTDICVQLMTDAWGAHGRARATASRPEEHAP